MTPFFRTWRSIELGLVVALTLGVSALWAADNARPAKIGDYNPKDQNVEMFQAIEKGDIAVRIIPKDSTLCRIQIENKTKKPLNIKLPTSFAAVPVLAQMGDREMGGGGRSSSRGGGGSQSMGGGMGGMGGMGGGGGFFNVPAENVGKFNVTTVCLEHGKAEPRAAIPYEVKPLESFTTKPGVRELCEQLGTGQVNQRAAQAAAWNLNNDMTWEQLAAKRIRHANGTSEPYFSQNELQNGKQLAFTSVRVATDRQKEQAEGNASDNVGASETK
jgi:uncharacterized membrane protein YgcG